MDNVTLLILIPVAAGLLMMTVPGRGTMVKAAITVLIASITGFIATTVYTGGPLLLRSFTGGASRISGLMHDSSYYMQFRIDGLSALIVLTIAVFSVLISLYALRGACKPERCGNFHAWFLLTTGLSYGAVLADNLLLFVGLWGLLAIALYKLIPSHDDESSAAAKKTLIIIGSSDGIMILGIAILYSVTGTLTMSSISVEIVSGPEYIAFFALLAGSFAKAGAFPLHSWIPGYAGNAPAVSSAYLPASLDKLLGIYFLVRVCHHLFVMSDLLVLLILLAAVITIIAAVMMALVQHEYMKLLGFHAISQVGYMILGIGLGTPAGIAAGLFHMLNNAIYKSGLFLGAGNLKAGTGEDDLDRLGGLSGKMPVTFLLTLIFALSISGVPPFNGFASKWMIYNEIINFGTGTAIASRLWILWLAVAVLGSALTLASFMKFLGSAFLSPLPERLKKTRESGISSLLPGIILAMFCIFLGVFATGTVVPRLFFPITGEFEFHGAWQPAAVTVLILFAIILGMVIYFATATGRIRRAGSFVGGEKTVEERGFAVTGFYETVRNAPLLSGIYNSAFRGRFDLYHIVRDFVLWINTRISRQHDGILQTYTAWVFGGLVILLLILM